MPGGRVPAGLERVEPDLGASRRPGASQAAPAQRDQQETAAFHLARARTLVDQRRDREAIEELRRAIYLAPYEDEPHLLLGHALPRAGRLPEAIDEFKVAIWSRETAAAHIALGSALLDAGDSDGASGRPNARSRSRRRRPGARALKRIGG